MGFDVYGLNPKLNTKKPSSIKYMDSGENTSWSDRFLKLSIEDRDKYIKDKHKWENENKGIYFRNNCWFWRPLWDYVYHICDDLITEEQWDSGHCNNGESFNTNTAKEIAIKLYTSVEDGRAEAYKERYMKEPDNDNSNYPFDVENVKEFADFCNESGGFQIY